ncbi:5959_t:CDS:2 [Diversispora eburnea]|uniref:5959_t:CDS:1 n=1 Tax=Diversispora eburnea TaxID=1213867 RepID=A0A9N9AU41_9GLOM|nr:5959_t:CDS:2 [Diversispora eburnea]
MSINQLCNDPDEEVKEAAAVLENMKQTSTHTSSPHEATLANPNGEGFMSRLMNAYEQGKATSPFIKFTSEMVESSVSRISEKIPVGAGATAGAAGAVVSEEAMKSLQYCLQWLNYAAQHIDHQIAVLRDFIVQLTTPSSSGSVITSPTSTLASIKREVVDTLRKVIEVVSKYASSCLPDHAKSRVRSFILNLPTRWASINHIDTSLSPRSSPHLGPTHDPNHQTADYARRLLSLATESLGMLRNVGDIFGDTVDRAEAWIYRLRVLGVRGNAIDHTAASQFEQPIGWSTSTSLPQQQQNGSIPNGGGYASPYGQPTSQHASSSPSSTGSRSRRSSSSNRMNNHASRKHIRPTIFQNNDEDEDIDTDSSTDSDVEEDKRMEDNRSHRSPKSSNVTKSALQHNGSISARKRKKAVKKDENDKMDLS